MVAVPHTQFPPPQVISLAHEAKQGPNVATFVVQQIGFTQGLFESQLKLRVMENNNTGFKNRYLDLPRSAEWMVRDAYTPSLRVRTTSLWKMLVGFVELNLRDRLMWKKREKKSIVWLLIGFMWKVKTLDFQYFHLKHFPCMVYLPTSG